MRRHTLVSESGLYKLIMRSNKDTARPFQDYPVSDTGLSQADAGAREVWRQAKAVT